jgi:hypothetical protein
MFKFATIGAFKQVRNNPRCKATMDVKDGMVVLPDDATGNAPVPATAADAQKEVWIVGNIIDKPEVLDSKTFVVANGEPVRAFLASDAKELPVEIDDSVLVDSYASLAVGDVLVAAGDGSGKWVKADGTTIVASTYKVNLKIIEKTAYGDNGLYCVVKVN